MAVVVVVVAYTSRGKKSRAAGELFIIIRGCGLSLGSHENKGSWGEPHESVFAQHFCKETKEETISNLVIIVSNDFPEAFS